MASFLFLKQPPQRFVMHVVSRVLEAIHFDGEIVESHSLSTCSICSAMSQAGGSDASIRSSSVAPDTIRSARAGSSFIRARMP